ncbi:MAG: ATP-binding protein [Candidatus Methanomethylophilaceae archaeon]|jgi:predicted AAA+ superfamily ATPase
MNDTYLKRIVDSQINEYLESVGSLLIEGPKWCGKTRTAEEHSKSSIHIVSKNQIESLRLAAESGSVAFLEGETPKLIDEWQDVPEIWNVIRFEVDRRRENGQFILTGSSVPPEDPLRHSGAGRIARISMRTMSLFESGDSNGSVSLESMLESETIDGYADTKIEQLADVILRGGWPLVVSDDRFRSDKVVRDYLKSVVMSNLSRVDGVQKILPLQQK